MKVKKGLLLSILYGSLCLLPSSIQAAESESPEVAAHEITAIVTDGMSRASWGTGTLTSANPLGRKPWAYATTETFAGTAYIVRARVSVTSGGYTDSTSWAEEYNAASVSSATIIARTETGVIFTGEHSIRDTASSGWQGVTTSESY